MKNEFLKVQIGITYAATAKEMVDNVTAMFSQDRNVRSLEKNTFGSTFVGTLRSFSSVLGSSCLDDPSQEKLIHEFFPMLCCAAVPFGRFISRSPLD